jgi:hypothetical protein
MRVALPELLPAKAHCDARDCSERKSRSGVDARHNESIRRDSRLEVVLGFVEVAIGQVIEAEIQFHSSADLLGHSQVDNGMSGGDDRRILPVPTSANGSPRYRYQTYSTLSMQLASRRGNSEK